MSGLTEEGRTAVEAVARRNGVGTDAAMALLQALRRGGGAQAQFSHPELGGMGQWSRGGMIMVGDMFNSALKARVDALCTELAELMGKEGLFAPGRRLDEGWHGASWNGESWNGESWNGESWNGESWWPEDLGVPSSSGGQNDLRYAFFPQTRRLAIARGDHVDLYDTGEHRIHGVSQQQGAGQDLRFTSQLGSVALHDLSRVGGGAAASSGSARMATSGPGTYQTQSQSQGSSYRERAHESGVGAEPARDAMRRDDERSDPPARAKPHMAPTAEDDVFAKLERLHELQRKGILTEAEFAEKKKELLARI